MRVLSDRKAAIAGTQIFTGAAEVGILSEEREAMRQQIDETVGRGLVVFSDVYPDAEDIAACPRSQTVGHLTCLAVTEGSCFGLELLGEERQRFVGVVCVLAGLQVGFRFIKGGEHLQARPFLPFPQGERLLDGFLGAMEASGRYRLADEGFLFGGELHFHNVRLAGDEAAFFSAKQRLFRLTNKARSLRVC